MGRIKVVVLLLLTFGSVEAQPHRYMVFLSDKDASNYSLEEPTAFLSQKAIERRLSQGIDLTEEDIPVSQEYVNQISAVGVSVFFSSKWMNALLVQMDEQLIPEVEAFSFVDSIEYIARGTRLSFEQVPVEIATTFKTPTSITSDTKLQLSMLYADVMHQDGFKGEGMYIAILDSGFPGINEYKPFEHIHKENRLIGYKDFVTNSGNPFQYNGPSSAHGSSVLSLIGMDYGEEVQGIAPKAGFILCVTEDVSSEYRIEEYNWLLGAEYADSIGADVINSSLGYSTFNDITMNYNVEELDGKTAVVSWAATKAASKGMIVVVSAGNEGNKPWKYVTPPGDAEDVLVVGSVNSLEERASFSSLGPTSDGRIKPDVMALGSPTTVFDGSGSPDNITWGSGTSYSAPLIAGFAAAIWQANPEWTNEEVINAIKFSGNYALSPNIEMGYGIPDYRLAVMKNTLSVVDIFENKLEVYPNPFHGGKINIDLSGLKGESFIDLVITDLQGSSLINKRINLLESGNDHVIEFPAAADGVYLLKVSSLKYQKTIKLIKF